MIVSPQTSHGQMSRMTHAELAAYRHDQFNMTCPLPGEARLSSDSAVIYSFAEPQKLPGTASLESISWVVKAAGICPLKGYADLTGSAIDYARNILQSMLHYLPVFLREDYADILRAQGVELRAFNSAAENGLNEFFVQTSTARIADWEAFAGLKTNPTKPIEQRRAVVLSKLRGYGTSTVERIQAVADAYENGTVEVTEDPANYKVTVKFTSIIGIPPNYEDCAEMLAEIVPAHIEIVYEFLCNTHATLHKLTHAQLAAFTHQQVRDSNDVAELAG